MKSAELNPYTDILGKYPSMLSEAFEGTLDEIEGEIEITQLVSWAAEGVGIAQATPRGWEASAEYFRASAKTLRVLSFAQFLRWAQTGASIALESTSVGAAFFRASPLTLSNIPPRYINNWATLGKSLNKGTWKSSTLAARFFDISSELLRSLEFPELEEYTNLVETLSHRSYDLAIECLQLGQRILPSVQDRKELISLARALATNSWREVRGCFEAMAKINGTIDSTHRARFMRLAERLSRRGMHNVAGIMLEMTEAMARVPATEQGELLEMAESLVERSPESVVAFLKNVPKALERISLSQIGDWFHHGVVLLLENVDAGIAYFKLESSRSEQILDNLSSSVELDKVKSLFSFYARALVGASVELGSSDEIAQKNIGWVSGEQATTDGKNIYLPSMVNYLEEKRHNFAWLKVVATHQLGHLEFGSFLFELGKPSTLFEDLRPRILGKDRPSDHPTLSGSPDIALFFDMFAQRKLVGDIFSLIEDSRIDAILDRIYKGLVADSGWVHTMALDKRPQIEDLPLQAAFLELMVRLSLDPKRPVSVPKNYSKEATKIGGILRHIQTSYSTVEDVAEATIRVYGILSELTNEEIQPEDWEEQNFENSPFEDVNPGEIADAISNEKDSDLETQETYQSPQDVDFRGNFKPEMVQLLNLVRGMEASQEEASDDGLSQEALEELLRANTDVQADGSLEPNTMANNVMKEKGANLPPSKTGSGFQDIPHEEERGNSLENEAPRSYVYDEWDFRANDYRPRWCVVQEKSMASGETRFYSETLDSHAHLMNQIRRQFEIIKPELLRKVKHLSDGEDVDLDTGIEALIDIRSGVAPSEEIYWRRNKADRDVAVAFLLDMSASTAEAVEEGKNDNEWDMPSDPAAYANWLRIRRGERGKRTYKRIIDVEKEAMVLLMTALDLIGDRFGVYGFSGFGRENVEFYVIKDVEEALTDEVKGRLEKVSPLHATRMGPAIRHATAKLAKINSKTKLLFVISDGRPQDRGYSREGVEKEYAVQDTRMALLEARKQDITPFCLTVDRQGHDYLRTMAGDMGYEVLPDVMALPSRLPQLYRRITN